MARVKGCKEYAVFARVKGWNDTEAQWEFRGFAVTVKGDVVAIDDHPVTSVSMEEYQMQLVEMFGLSNLRIIEFG